MEEIHNQCSLLSKATIRCARFLGNDKANLLDRVNIEVYLPSAIEEAIKFIQRNTRLSSEITGLRRKDIPEYPLMALREAIVNAVVHADYSIKGVYTSIVIFDDHIEITNPEELQEPKFEELNNQFRVTLYGRKIRYGKKISRIVLEVWQKELINYLRKKEKISTKEAAHLWKVTVRTARTRLIKLIDAGFIKKTGSSLKDPFGYYILK
ncbi:MAG TPA: DeoR family transcriptional regulator [Candidatus Babeliales bacterium]|jgi:predicted HTH transcriptional regulator|nr:DeoR family transcriptional regulator [Candidatus Babeliales bacterium]